MTVEIYRPSNGTEGEWFMANWCHRCERDRAFREGDGDSCQIAANTMAYDRDHPDYPEEWRYNDAGRPVCTAFVWAGDEVGWPLDPEAVVRDLFAEARP